MSLGTSPLTSLINLSLSLLELPSASNYVLQKQTDTRPSPWADNINLSLPQAPSWLSSCSLSQTSQNRTSIRSAHCLTWCVPSTCLQCTFSLPAAWSCSLQCGMTPRVLEPHGHFPTSWTSRQPLVWLPPRLLLETLLWVSP